MKNRNILLGLVMLVMLISGANAIASTITATQISPADNSWDDDLIVVFNCSATPTYSNFTNMSLYLNGVINQTCDITDYNSGSVDVNGTAYCNWSWTFPADSCTGWDWACEAYNNETNSTTTTNDTIKLDATNPTISCDRGSDYFTVERGDVIEFTSADNCEVASRSWTKDGGTTTSSIFVIAGGTAQDDISTTGWQRSAYDVAETVTDSAGHTATATCYLSAMSKRTEGQRITVSAPGPVTLRDGELVVEESELEKNLPILLIVIIVISLIVIKNGKGKRRKKGKKKKHKR